MNCYKRRSKNLSSIGFKSYPEYLNSKLWKAIRSKVLKNTHFKCDVCRGKATQVHHRSYSVATLLGKEPRWLIPICGECHVDSEFDESGGKRTVSKTNSHMNSKIWASGRRVRGQCVSCKKNPTRNGQRVCGKCKKMDASLDKAG